MKRGGAKTSAASLLLLLASFGCGDSAGPDLDAIASVTVGPSAVSVEVGFTTQMTATVLNGRNERVVDAVVGWASLAPSIGTVSEQGLVTALSEGETEITASAGERSGSSTITVTLPVELIVEVAPATAVVLEGQVLQLSATVTGTGTDDFGVSWTIDGEGSGNATVGTVSSAGLYTAPAVISSTLGVAVRATSTVDDEASAIAELTVATAGEDWPQYRRDLAKTGQSAEAGLSSANVGMLMEAWRFQTGGRVSASPAIATVGGARTLYVGTWTGEFFAIDTETGAERWRYQIDVVEEDCGLNWPERIASSAAVQDEIVYFGSGSGFIYALSAAGGGLVWKTQLGDPCLGYEIWSSPTVYDGIVYIGVASRDGIPCVVGRVDALDATTGDTVWSFDTIDQSTSPDGDAVGAGVWSSPAIDTEFGLLWVGTGNNRRGCSPPSKNAEKYPDGILALDLATGLPVSFFQTFPNDLNDEGDVGATPVLHRTRILNECTGSEQIEHWLTVPTKDSKVFTGRRGAMGFIGDPSSLELASGPALGSPALRPFVESRPCGSGSLRTIEEGNDVFVPIFAGTLFDIRQDPDGTIDFRWDLSPNPCAGLAVCPLFSAPAVITDLVFFGGGEGNFYAATTEGALVYAHGTDGLVASGPAISHGGVYFGSYDGFVYALTLSGGAVP